MGVAISESAMPGWVGWLSSSIIWAGAAQFATVSLAGSVSWLTLVATAAIINSRHVMYSAATASRFADQPRWFRWVGPYLLIDQVFAMTAAVPDLSGRRFRRYYVAIGLFFWVGWHICVSLGMAAGSVVPESWRLGTAPAIMFAGFVVLGIRRWPGAVAAVVAATVCALTLGMPNRLGLLVGAIAGVAAGAMADTFAARADAG